MKDSKIIPYIHGLGHFDNPDHPTGVTEADLSSLKLTDKSTKIALASFQDSMVLDFDRLSNLEHGRVGVTDGIIGPATQALLDVPRCGMPDYGLEATGRGSWPSGCHKDVYPDNHSFAVYFEFGSMPSFWKPIFDQAWLLVRKAYADIGMAFFETKDQSKANTVVSWTRGRGWIGLAIVPNGPRCSDKIWAKFDNSYNPRDLVNQIARLLAHELCHNMGLSHSRGGIMNPSIVSGVFSENAWRGDPSESSLVRFFGGELVRLVDLDPPIPPDPDPDPDPDDTDPPVPTNFWFKGDLELMEGDKPRGFFDVTLKLRSK